MQKTSVDIEDLYRMFTSDPKIKEKPDAEEFNYKKGAIKFENLTFKHYFVEENVTDNQLTSST